MRPLTIEDICKKLKPIFGEKIDLVYLKYKVTDDLAKKREIEQALNALYSKYLNQSMITDKILLEPPSQELIKGEYPLGTISYADKDLYAFGLREKDWIRHVCISGMSGSGKTTFAFQILGNFILKDKPFIVFDWKRSFRPLLKIDKNILNFTVGNNAVSNLFRININEPPKGVEPREWLNILCDLVNESFFASFGVHKLLREAIDKAYRDFGVYKGSKNYPTWHQIKDRLENYDTRGKRESEWLESALRIASTLTFGAFGEAINSKDRCDLKVEDLFSKRTIFELHSLNNSEKKFFCEFLLTYIYKLKKSSQEEITSKFTLAILVDEAHNIFLKDKPNFIKESITDMVYREVREYGISLICLDQHISKLSDTVAGNSATNVAFQQVLPMDVQTVSSIMQLRDERKYFSMLAVGEAIVLLAERYHSPFLIRAPFIDIQKSGFSDEMVKKRMDITMKQLKQKKVFEQKCDDSTISKKVRKLENIYKASGVSGVNKEFVEKQLPNEEETSQEKAPKPEKKRIILTNHLQKNCVQLIDEDLKKGKDLKIIKKELLEEGYKRTDIEKAAKYYLLNLCLSTIERNFLKYLANAPETPTAEVYTKLELSARKGNSIKNKLVSLGLLAIEEVKSDKGRTKLLRPTDKAFSVV